jgi:hypothetical protein
MTDERTGMRRLLVSSALLPAALWVVPAAAAPVSSGRLAAVRFSVPAGEGDRLQVELRAVRGSEGDRLRVAVQRCDAAGCASPRYFDGPLPAGALTVSPDSPDARLHAVIGGLALRAAWSPDPSSGAVLGGLEGGGTDAGFVEDAYRADPARVLLEVAGGSCRGAGAVGDDVRLSAPDGTLGDAAPLGALHLAASGSPACNG